jgi:hypothetical protein
MNLWTSTTQVHQRPLWPSVGDRALEAWGRAQAQCSQARPGGARRGDEFALWPRRRTLDSKCIADASRKIKDAQPKRLFPFSIEVSVGAARETSGKTLRRRPFLKQIDVRMYNEKMTGNTP